MRPDKPWRLKLEFALIGLFAIGGLIRAALGLAV